MPVSYTHLDVYKRQKYAYAIAYEEGGAEGWLTAEHRGEGLLTLIAEPWDDMERDRRATLTITVGDDETSKAAVAASSPSAEP